MVEDLNLSGYQPYTEVIAQKTERKSGRKTFIVALPLHLLSQYVPIPDPDRPFPGNRRVQKRHAEKFGEYWRENETWAAPPLLLDTTAPLDEDFEVKFRAAGVEIGVLKIYQSASSQFAILDGQHRILGWKLVGDRMARELKNARADLQLEIQRGDEEAQDNAQKKIDRILEGQRRFESEYVTLEIMQGVSDEDHKQAFNDIATNARGITKSVTASFDRRHLVNRVAGDLPDSVDFLRDRVDWEKDRIAGANENLISGKNLADIVRHVAVGIDGRMTVRREEGMSESSVYDHAELFFKTLLDSFPQLRQLDNEEISPGELREKDMIMSATILRILAGVFHILAVDITDESSPQIDGAGLEKTKKLFQKLSKQTSLPVNDQWMATGFFGENAKAPSSRAQDLRGLTNLIAQWGEQGELFTPKGNSQD
ncbi:DNA sulfur modification protein DndB [Corynebacterium suicordis]